MADSMIDTLMIQIIVASKQGKWLVGSVHDWSIGTDFQENVK